MHQMSLIKPKDVQWGLEQGYKYVHLGLIKYCINPLVRPSLNVSFLACVIDSHQNQFTDALLGGFEAPLHNGLVWSSIILRYQDSLTDPHINELLQDYIHFLGFNMTEKSDITKLHSIFRL